MNHEQAKRLREPFPPEAIGSLPKGGTTLDYVGHAAVTDRLLEVDPDWTWEPPTKDELERLPAGDGMWIKLTICGTTRFGWGDGKNVKEWISDAIRNAAMRFGVALDLWSKEELPSHASDRAVSANRVGKLKSRCMVLSQFGVDLAEHRHRHRLPVLDACDDADLDQFELMVTQLESAFLPPPSGASNQANDEAAVASGKLDGPPAPDTQPPCEDDAAETEEQMRARITEEVKAMKPTDVLLALAEGDIAPLGTPAKNRGQLVDYLVWCELGRDALTEAAAAEDSSPTLV